MNDACALPSKEKMTLRTRIILFLSLMIPFAFAFLYVLMTATELIISDDAFLVKGGFIEKYLSGTLAFGDLWQPLNYGRMLGYNLMQLANVKWFSMNSKILVLLAPFCMLASALLIYREYRKSLAPALSPDFIAATFFIITFIIFNVTQWEGLIVGSDMAFQPAMPFFIASFLSLELFIVKGGRKYLSAALVVPVLAMLVFNGRLNLVFIPASGLILLSYAAIHRGNLNGNFLIRSLMMGLFLVLLLYVYLSGIQFDEFSPAGAAVRIFAKPWDAAQFILAALGSSIVGIDVFSFCSYISFDEIVALGMILVMLYALALVLFFTSKMYEKTCLPAFLIVQTFLFLGIMMIGRFEFGKDYGMTSRYTCVSLYGLAGMVWIFAFILSGPKKINVFLRGTIFAGVMIIIAGLIMTSVFEWNLQPRRKAYLDQLTGIALRVDTASPEDLSRISDLPDRVRDSLLILREHRLNVYRNRP